MKNRQQKQTAVAPPEAEKSRTPQKLLSPEMFV
jgi:hypothetical protein